MKTEPIITALDDALEATKDVAADGHDLGMLLALAAHEPERVDSRVPYLIAVLAKDPSLEPFNGRMVVWPSSAMRVDHQNLAGWLLRHGSEVGSRQAVADLARYLGVTEIPCLVTVAVAGIKIAEPCDLGGGVSLIPWDALPDSGPKRAVHRNAFEAHSFHLPSAAIVREETLPKNHLTQEAYQASFPQLTPLDDAGLQDALLCVGMIGPCAPYPLAMFLTAPSWVPVSTGGMGMPLIEGWPVHKEWSQGQGSDARTLHLAFLDLNKARKDLLRLAMQRLNRAMRRHLPVDAAIDLGIALEALFLSDMPDERGEPTFRLKLRAARYLGSTKADRDSLFDLVGDLYGARSSAVHTGRVSDQIKTRPIGEVLAEGYAVAAGAIRRMVLEGPPDWRQIMLG